MPFTVSVSWSKLTASIYFEPHFILVLSIISSARSSSFYSGDQNLVYYIPAAQRQLFQIFQIWSSAAYIHSLITFTLIQCSTYRTKPGNAFAWITLTTHACTNEDISCIALYFSAFFYIFLHFLHFSAFFAFLFIIHFIF